MAIAILAALVHRRRTGEGTWVDMACTEAGAALLGPVVLDATVNGRNLRRPGMPNSNRSSSPLMAPHGIFPAAGEDNWVAIACRDDEDWARLARVVGEPWATGAKWVSLAQRVACEDELDELIRAWTVLHDRFTLSEKLQAAGVRTAAVQRPSDRVLEISTVVSSRRNGADSASQRRMQLEDQARKRVGVILELERTVSWDHAKLQRD
jgi:benzylsuccinate CoA-transferase BbsF subunit